MRLVEPGKLTINGKPTTVYYVVWSEGERSRRRSTRTADPEQAKRFKASLSAAKEAPPDGPTIGEILDGYLRDRENIVVDYQRLVDASKPLGRHFGGLQPTHITRLIVHGYRQGISGGTRRRELGMLVAALRWAVREEWIERFPHVTLPPRPPGRERWLTKQEAERLIDAATEPHIRLFIVLALYTAARKSAILDLTWDRVDFVRRLIWFPNPGRRTTAKRRAVVPFRDNLADHLVDAQELAQSDWVIEWNGKPVKSVKRSFAAARARAGLGKDVVIHTLRHTAATWMAQEGIEMRKISLFLGHESIATTERIYAHWSPDYLRDAVEALDAHYAR